MTPWERYFVVGRRAGCPKDQMERFQVADAILQERQLAASAAARLCDRADGSRLRRGPRRRQKPLAFGADGS